MGWGERFKTARDAIMRDPMRAPSYPAPRGREEEPVPIASIHDHLNTVTACLSRAIHLAAADGREVLAHRLQHYRDSIEREITREQLR